MLSTMRPMRERLEALEWVRRQMMHMNAPDAIRQRQREARIREACSGLVRRAAVERAGRKGSRS